MDATRYDIQLYRRSQQKSLWLGIVFGALVQCAAVPVLAADVAPPQSDNGGPAQQIAQQWARLYNGEKLEPLVALYAPDGEFFPTSGERVAGTAALRALFQGALAVNKPVIQMTSVTSARSGNLAYDSGEYVEIITRKASGQAYPLTGHYLIVCRLSSGNHWSIAQQMWTLGAQKEK